MIGKHTKRTLDAAVDELKRDGYATLVIMLDQNKPEHTCSSILLPEACEKAKRECPACNPKSSVEVLCSHTNDPRIVAAMLQETLSTLTRPAEGDRLN